MVLTSPKLMDSLPRFLAGENTTYFQEQYLATRDGLPETKLQFMGHGWQEIGTGQLKCTVNVVGHEKVPRLTWVTLVNNMSARAEENTTN